MNARTYLVDRFRGDAATLHERAAALAGGAAIPGPDLATSRQMAEACEAVVALVQLHGPTDTDAEDASSALLALIPTLDARSRAATHPAVRAVFAGAVARIRELHAADTADAQESDVS